MYFLLSVIIFYNLSKGVTRRTKPKPRTYVRWSVGDSLPTLMMAGLGRSNKMDAKEYLKIANDEKTERFSKLLKTLQENGYKFSVFDLANMARAVCDKQFSATT